MIEIRNAVIESATLSIHDQGFLDAWLMLDYDGMGQGFGGYALYQPKTSKHHKLESRAGHFIYRVLEIAEANDWSKLKGKIIRVRRQAGIAVAIGHIIKDDWFCPRDDFAALQNK